MKILNKCACWNHWMLLCLTQLNWLHAKKCSLKEIICIVHIYYIGLPLLLPYRKLIFWKDKKKYCEHHTHISVVTVSKVLQMNAFVTQKHIFSVALHCHRSAFYFLKKQRSCMTDAQVININSVTLIQLWCNTCIGINYLLAFFPVYTWKIHTLSFIITEEVMLCCISVAFTFMYHVNYTKFSAA
jgi:hypothetical protein